MGDLGGEKEGRGSCEEGKENGRKNGFLNVLIWGNKQGPSGPFSNYRPDGPVLSAK